MKQLLDSEGLLGGTVIDETSHFILRLSYCQTEDLRRWFLLHECELLRLRLQLLPHDQLGQLVESYLNIKPIDEVHKQELRPNLLLQKPNALTGLGGNSTNNNTTSNGMVMSVQEFQKTQYFAVPFVQALDLIARRECYLEGGQAYISQHKVEAILVGQFRAQLSRQLASLQTHVSLDTTLQHDAEGSRVYPLLKNLSRCLVHKEQLSSSSDYAALHGADALTAATVATQVSHMPLCMREMHRGMKRHGKLRHFGRLQYGFFLKGAGLDLDNALLFFQRHFTAITADQFQKEYSYNIRYNYGKEGKRKSRDPYSCAAIIHGNAPSQSGDHHGCPYKHYDDDHLANLLQHGLSLQDRKEILALKKEGHYGLACHKHFLAQHPKALELAGGSSSGGGSGNSNNNNPPPVPLDNIGNHPNAWFRASRAYQVAMTMESTSTSSSFNTESPTKTMNVISGSSSNMVENHRASTTTAMATVSPN